MSDLFQLLLTAWVTSMVMIQTYGLGLIVTPHSVGDNKKYSSINNLLNCVSYPTVKDDIIILTVDSGEKLPSQVLNMNIFDSENNKIRYKGDISEEMNLIFTNLNNPSQINRNYADSPDKRNILNKIHLGRNKEQERVDELMNSDTGKSLIYICFDNLYSDKSWSFQPQDRDVEIFVDIKNMTTIKQTNYNLYAQYFKKFKYNSDQGVDAKNNEKKSKKEGTDKTLKKDFTQNDFENNIKLLESELSDIVENLKNSELILTNLMEQESKLRDANERIFSEYTKVSIIMIVAISIFGMAQLVYFRCYLKKRKYL
ncbi:DEHA2G17226p [Debaryomyces hansenii CBS767]|uniref:DEHA2G17226p n=1 Tax=Debaryomyces hansenii (strain ATCC 36239 / CBS 767 / BCRC 21394 / JCM 1990 / NBRC 0083 / IGC 2968) TaxID=284592 RepID=Q6BHN3_DEBHA|nr:DEHA2G17226p [Debaryomyces hansenii CBS767]CAG90794.2 DEHA2G17226p [Debaryomyces hansenii CBS767]|eukprot:XP_462288.2 DEHA2G17226p [Debaryomyces hansenii CBS767]